MDFDYSISLPSICTPVTMGAVAAIHEYKGKQELYQALKPESFEKLAAVARVQSIGSSNKIEGNPLSEKQVDEVMLVWKRWQQGKLHLGIAMSAKLRDTATYMILSMNGMPISRQRRTLFFSCIAICSIWSELRLLAGGKTPTTLSLSACPVVGSERVLNLPALPPRLTP